MTAVRKADRTHRARFPARPKERWLPPKADLPRAGSGSRIMFYVYILSSCKAKRLYKGLTSDLRRRFKEHNSGHVSATKGYRPWKLIYFEAFVHKRDAEAEEKFLKSGKGRERLKYLLQFTTRRGG